ncbi:MAG TPA: MOSC domain-containing protein [Bacilli bacterium]|nr:MOSC domain-containing protein [Bacilli bacterium]
MATSSIEVVAINVGLPQTRVYDGEEIYTSIYKDPIDAPVYLSNVNFAGDGQGDLVHHGGLEKAVNVYCQEHYAYWEQELGQDIGLAAFGENLTVRGLPEEDVYIGDTFQLGEAVVQVCQPRIPCDKLNKKHGVPDLVARVRQTGYSGYYLRVLQEGTVAPGDTLVPLERDPHGVTVMYANNVFYHDTENVEALHRILAVEALAEVWQGIVKRRLAQLEEQKDAGEEA